MCLDGTIIERWSLILFHTFLSAFGREPESMRDRMRMRTRLRWDFTEKYRLECLTGSASLIMSCSRNSISSSSAAVWVASKRLCNLSSMLRSRR